jgi:hypothetical protein
MKVYIFIKWERRYYIISKETVLENSPGFKIIPTTETEIKILYNMSIQI